MSSKPRSIQIIDELLSLIDTEFNFFEKLFVYESDYDTNGICYFFGTEFNKKKWRNPSEKGLIRVSSCKWHSGSFHDIVGRTAVDSCSERVENAWFAIDFGDRMKIKPTYYTLRHHTYNNICCIRYWNFEGSNDEKNWFIIKQHKNDTTLCEIGQSNTWKITNCNAYYQHFRIILTGKHSGDQWRITATGFEIYGYLTGNK
eukprot:360705_1